MEALRQTSYKFWIITTTLMVWWLYASMALCSAFSVFSTGEGGTTDSPVSISTAMMSHSVDHHSMSMMNDADNMSVVQTLKVDKHCGDQFSSHDANDLCCDDLQEGSVSSGQAPATMLFAVALVWTSYVFEPAQLLVSTFSDLAVPIPWPAIYLLVCSFLK